MKAFIENWTFRFTFEGKDYILTVDDDCCDYGCTFSVMLRDSTNLDDFKKKAAARNLKYHLYEITEVNINGE